MANQKLAELSNEDLRKREIFLKAITFALTFLLIAFVGFTIYNQVLETSKLIPIALPLAVILIFNFSLLGKIKKEIKARNIN